MVIFLVVVKMLRESTNDETRMIFEMIRADDAHILRQWLARVYPPPTALSYAIDADAQECVALLLEDATSNEASLALRAAIRAGSLDTIVNLVQRGANVNYQYMTARTPLDSAVLTNRIDIVQFLTAQGARSARGKSILLTAVHHPELSSDMFTYLISREPNINVYDEHNDTPLMIATREGVVTASSLLAQDARVNWFAQNDIGETVLHCAAAANNVEILRAALAAGVDVNAVTQGGQTALHMATATLAAECIGVLLEHNINLDARDSMGSVALVSAILSGNGPIVYQLIDAGANPNIGASAGDTCLSLAVEMGHEGIVGALVYAGATITQHVLAQLAHSPRPTRAAIIRLLRLFGAQITHAEAGTLVAPVRLNPIDAANRETLIDAQARGTLNEDLVDLIARMRNNIGE